MARHNRLFKVLQVNGQRAAAVAGQLRVKVVEEELSVLLLQEPYVAFNRVSGYPRNARVIVGNGENGPPWAAVVVCDPNINVVKMHELCDEHVVCVYLKGAFGELYVVSIYCQFRDPIDGYLSRLDNILMALYGRPVLIGMDSNAKSPMWFGPVADERGAKLEELILQHDLTILNESSPVSTFSSVHGESNIDVTLVSSAAARLVSRWRVWQDWSTSDHRCITVEVGLAGCHRSLGSENRFAVRGADWSLFDSLLSDVFGGDRFYVYDALDVEAKALCFQSGVMEVCNVAIPKRTRVSNAVPWWSAELGRLRKQVNSSRRLMQRYRRRGHGNMYTVTRTRYLRLKNDYNQSIKRAKTDSWRRLVSEEGNRSPWGLVHKMVLSKLNLETVLSSVRPPGGGPASMSWSETVSVILDSLIPNDSPLDDSDFQRRLRESVQSYWSPTMEPEFDDMEIDTAIGQCRVGRSPGLDLMEVEVLKRVWLVCPQVLTSLYNECLALGIFPQCWKTGSLKLLLKSNDKPTHECGSYRPICLLPVAGKVLERLFVARLMRRYCTFGLSSSFQFGFKKGCSSEDAMHALVRARESPDKYVGAVFIDIKGAFDNLWWPAIFERLRRMFCPVNLYYLIYSYLFNRKVAIYSAFDEVQRTVVRGCPQGSVCGPVFWNMVFDDLLSLDLGTYTQKIAYADDLVLTVSGGSRTNLESRLCCVLDKVIGWCAKYKLEISSEKTVAMLIKGKLHHERPPVVPLGTTNLKWSHQVKYLGVLFDSQFTFLPHVKTLRDKVRILAAQLGRVTRVDWGLKKKVLRVMYRAICIPIVTYCSSIWVHRIYNSHVLRQLLATQRVFLLAMCRACRTTSTPALQVLNGCIPLDLEIIRTAHRYHIRKGRGITIHGLVVPEESPDQGEDMRIYCKMLRMRTLDLDLMNIWQTRWQHSTKGRVTARFFPKVGFFPRMVSQDPPFELTCFLTGHGPFKAKLNKLGISEDENCLCGDCETSEHLLFDCDVYNYERRELIRKIGISNLMTDSFYENVMFNTKMYQAFKDFAKSVLDRRRSILQDSS